MNEVRVSINPDSHGPIVEIEEIGNPKPGEGFAIPAELWRDLRRAWDRLTAAENAILRYVAEHYPDSSAREWMERRS